MGSLSLAAGDHQIGREVRRNSTLICVPILSHSVDEMLIQMRKAKDIGADLVELRLDFLNYFNPPQQLQSLIQHRPLPTLITYRPTWEGGKYNGDESKRLAALRLAVELGSELVDVELKVANEFLNSVREKKPENVKIIVSSHNYENTPSVEELGNLVARIQASGCDVVKIATTALDIVDNARIFQDLPVLKYVPMIGLAMGEKGLMSRILSAKFGGFMTFGLVESGAESAPGQPTVKELLELYNFSLIGADTKVHGVIGNPIGHSKSPHLYNPAFKSVGFNGIYLPLLVDSVSNFLSTFSSPDFVGYSYTIPHKVDGLRCCDEVDPIAQAIGAISCMIKKPDGKLKGYNVDYLGAITAIEEGLRESMVWSGSGSPLAGKLFVVMGAGGAGKALAYGAKEKGARVIVANRTYEKGRELASNVGGEAVALSDLKDFRPEQGMILANATSVGMKPNIHLTPIPKEALKHYSLVFDAIYTPKLTRLLRESQEAGAAIVYGTEMFINQAFVQFENFTGLPAPKQFIRELLARNT